MKSSSTIVLIRHGETEWSKSGQHTGRTDLPLTQAGAADAAALRPMLKGHTFGLVLISPMHRTRETAKLAGMHGEIDGDLLEWDYGAWEGRTTSDIRKDLGNPNWTIWSQRIPPGATPGEQPDEVAVRAGRVLKRCEPTLQSGMDCALIAHGHFLRILTATWLGLPAVDGRLFELDAGALSVLGFEHEQEVIRAWNATLD